MTTMELYLIRHMPSGGYLPAPETMSGRGGSRMVPTPAEKRPPRLFRSYRAAQSALAMWLKGEFVREHSFDGEDRVRVQSRPNRKKDEMEIVSVVVDLP